MLPTCFYKTGWIMPYIALYRKWRPLIFEDVVEQRHVVETLKNSVMMQKISHAYLFCGTRGTGKTTVARIFSRAINCLSPKNGDPCNECEICRGILDGSILDVIEIDAASNNSVDNIREIRDEVIYAPSRARYKVYIIDEVHMLSTGAFNALLKTLEEPPAHVVFFLATTEPHKLPATILSRCQRFDFRRITPESIAGRLDMIARANGTAITREAALLIAKMSEGAMRDAISILDQCMTPDKKEITHEDVLNMVGMVNMYFIADMVDVLIKQDIAEIFRLVEELVMSGKDIANFVSDMIIYYRNLLIFKLSSAPAEIVEVSSEIADRMKEQCKKLSQEVIMLIIKELSALESSMRWANHPRVMLEVSLIRIARLNFRLGSEDLAERLAVLEAKLNSAVLTARPSDSPVLSDNREALSNVEDAGENDCRMVEEKTPEKKKADNKNKSSNKKVIQGKEVECWDQIIAELKNCGRMSLYAYLQDTRAVELGDNLIGLVFKEGGGFKKTLVSKAENIEVIETVAAKKLGRNVRIKCIDENEAKDKAMVDQLIEKARDVAEKLDVPLNVIDT